ncbi:hypothetical protein PC116_g17982 [Phytophthora cactorum]|nr:hypothetical protein PC112_g18240 [Phytophthora cactorum]KAG2806859.1 hypothetical protein PC111_g17186 [Phytophthora cactorum]KAG2889842.1 hypothetical protein PC115_g19631 [Phytophthora cactorum]KAG2900239.1 hypothetical protein PC114_g13619 [Phytophthora cactorum]KAG2976073.1 hypothetical protein PC118_g13600 [Phytophthora cactorum]
MVDRRHENNFAELKKHTDLHPIKRNVTRWSSIFKMVERYIRIRPEIKKVDAVEEKLQLREGPDIAEVRVLFDTLISEYPVMAAHLKPTPFETGVVMVIPGSSLSLSYAESAALKRFEVLQYLGGGGGKRKDREGDYASMLLKGSGKSQEQVHGATSYMSLVKMISPTSNTVELMFSTCKLVLTPQRSAMLPANFEQLSFRRVNRTMWDATKVARVSAEETL